MLELPTLFRTLYASEGAGRFSANGEHSFINNEDGNISSITLYTNASGSSTVTVGRV